MSHCSSNRSDPKYEINSLSYHEFNPSPYTSCVVCLYLVVHVKLGTKEHILFFSLESIRINSWELSHSWNDLGYYQNRELYGRHLCLHVGKGGLFWQFLISLKCIHTFLGIWGCNFISFKVGWDTLKSVCFEMWYINLNNVSLMTRVGFAVKLFS